MYLFFFGFQNVVCIQFGNWQVFVGGYVVGELQGEILFVVYLEEGCEIVEIMFGIDVFVVKLGDQLNNIYVILCGDFFQNVLEESFQLDGSYYVVDVQ